MKLSYSFNSAANRKFYERSEIVTAVIRERRSIYADAYDKKEISPEQLEEILINATWAPTHKMTEPWRFVILSAEQQSDYGRYMAEYYRDYYPNLSPQERQLKLDYLRNYPLQAAAVIAIIFQPSTRISLPEWEEIAAISSAVQNMALTCTAMGLGSYWASGGSAINYVRRFLDMEQEQSLGLFFIGHPASGKASAKKRRTSINEKVTGFPHQLSTGNR